IVAINLATVALNGTTPQGTRLLNSGTFTRADGTTGNAFEAVFQTDLTDTVYHGDAGRPSWQTGPSIDAKGLGQIANLAAAIANDFDLADLVRTRAAAMTTPQLQVLVAQAGDVLAAWGYSENQTRELTPVLVSADGAALLDRAIYVEDASGGYWTLKS